MSGNVSPSPRRAAEPKLLALLCAAFFAVELIRTAWLADESFVLFRVADNFIHGFGLTFNPAERAQGFSGPLWPLLLSIPALAGISIPAAALFLNFAAGLAAFLLLSREARTIPASVLTVVLCVGSHTFVDYSTSGLANALAVLLTLVVAIRASSSGAIDTRSLGAWIALAVLTQPSLALLFLPIVYAQLKRDRISRRSFLSALWPLALWVLFAFWYYGSCLPLPAISRLSAGAPSWEFTKQGALYFTDLAIHDPVTALVILFGVIVPWISKDSFDRLCGAGIALHLMFILLTGGDAMSGRLFSCDFAVALLLVVRHTIQLAPLTQRGFVMIAVVAGFMAPHSNFLGASLRRGDETRASGIADARRLALDGGSLFSLSRLKELPVMDRGQFEKLLAQGAVTLDNPGPAGFKAGVKLHAVDPRGMTDPLLARLPLDGGSWEIGTLGRAVPAGYIESMKLGKSVLAERELNEYYERIMPILRGPLWSAGRFASIAAFQAGINDHLLSAYFGDSSKFVQIASLGQPKTQGAPWNTYGAFPIRAGGIEIALGRVRNPIGADMSIGSSGIYLLTFRSGDTTRGTLTIQPAALPGGALATAQIEIPEGVIEHGCDTIVVTSLNQDPKSSIGHLFLIE